MRLPGRFHAQVPPAPSSKNTHLDMTCGTCGTLLTTPVCGLAGSPLTMETADALVSTLVPNASGRAHNTHLETLVCGASDTMPQCIGVYP